jgi:hypothetical protein
MRIPAWAVPAGWVAGVSAGLLVAFPLGFVTYDTTYALLWGSELAHGRSPDYGSVLPPTPHPLVDLLGLLAEPLGGAATLAIALAIAYLSLGLVAYLVYRLGSLWFGRWIGVVAAALVITDGGVLGIGLRAYVDLPYVALCLGALVLESRRRRRGAEVLALLGVAGLLRPEAWLFAAAYWLWLAVDIEPTQGGRFGRRVVWRRERSPRELAWLALLAAAAPLLWALFDLITTGNPAYSFTDTRGAVHELERNTGPVDLVLHGPRRLGEIIQWPGGLAASGGIVLGFALLRSRVATGLVAAAMALVAFSLLGIAGLPIISRYTLLSALVLANFAALGLLGWTLLERGDPWRRRWQWFAAVSLLVYVAWIPKLHRGDAEVSRDLADQGPIERDLSSLAEGDALEPGCGPVAVPNYRAVPRVAFGSGLRPTEVPSAGEGGIPARGYLIAAADPFVLHNFRFGQGLRTRRAATAPPGFELVARNPSWNLYRRCRPGG